MTAKNKRKFSLLPWLLLLIVGGGWFLDAATRPQPAPVLPRQGRWKLITAKSMDGVSVRQSPNSLCHLEFRENGTIELITTTPDGRYFTDTLYWDEDNGQLRVDDKFLFLGGADHCDYIVQGSTLTIRYQVTSRTIVHNRVAVFRRAD